jgi:hypothetical protein
MFDPPSWVQADQRDCREAVQILCAMVGGMSSYQTVPMPLLVWFCRHRQVDLARAMEPADGSPPNIPEINAIKQDLATIEFVLKENGVWIP